MARGCGVRIPLLLLVINLVNINKFMNMDSKTTQKIEQPVTPGLKDLGKFDTMPEFADLWDKCVYEMMYDPKKYVEQFCVMLEKYGIGKNSSILDTAAGSGLPALDMCELGYKAITCVDASDDQIKLFAKKAEEKHLDIRSEKCLWQELPTHFNPEQFDALICKGSIWYAGGGWNKDFMPERESSLKVLKETLTIFHSLLKKDGVLYVDKFKDDEVDHKDTVGTFDVAGDAKELIFYAHRDAGIRRAQMIIKDIGTGLEEGLPNVTYDLKEEELEQILREVGFSVVKPNLPEEKFFVNWLAIKR